MKWTQNNNWGYYPEVSFLPDGLKKNDKSIGFELLACDNYSVFVRFYDEKKNLVKQYDIETGKYRKTFSLDSNTSHFSLCQNRVLICNYIRKEENRVGNSTIKIFDLEKNGHITIKEIKDFKVEAIWLCGDSVVVFGTNEDFEQYFFLSPYVQVCMSNRVEDEYLKEMHKTFTVYNLDFTSEKRKSLKKEININCGSVVKSIFFFALVDSYVLHGYDIKTKKIREYTRMHGKIKSLIGNNNKIIAHCDNSTFEIYDINTYQLRTIKDVPNNVNKLLSNDSLLFAVLDRVINVYDITSCHFITTISLPSNFYPNRIMVNDKFLIWKTMSGLIFQDCPLPLQELINKQKEKLGIERISIEERKKYYLE